MPRAGFVFDIRNYITAGKKNFTAETPRQRRKTKQLKKSYRELESSSASLRLGGSHIPLLQFHVVSP